jgi:hypothetical protein
MMERRRKMTSPLSLTPLSFLFLQLLAECWEVTRVCAGAAIHPQLQVYILSPPTPLVLLLLSATFYHEDLLCNILHHL